MAIINGFLTRTGAVCMLLLVAATASAQNVDSPTLDVAYLFGYGEYLIDSTGQTLYAFTEDASGESTCYDQCAESWPPVIVKNSTLAKTSLVTGEVGTIERTDGSLQLTYNSMPLYTFTQDNAIGEVSGDGANDVWFLVAASGELIRGSSQEAAVSGDAVSEESASLGGAMAGNNLSGEAAELFTLGEEVFTTTASPTCATCHGDQGQGGAGAALAGSDKLEDLDLIFSQVIEGGHIMPAFGSQLSNRQVAAVATYIRNAWGNDFGTASPAQANEAR